MVSKGNHSQDGLISGYIVNYYNWTQNSCFTHIIWTVLMYDPYWMVYPRDMAPATWGTATLRSITLPSQTPLGELRSDSWMVLQVLGKPAIVVNSPSIFPSKVLWWAFLCLFDTKKWFEIWSFAVAMRYGDRENDSAMSGRWIINIGSLPKDFVRFAELCAASFGGT